MSAFPNLQETFSGDFQNLLKFSTLEIQHSLFLSTSFGTILFYDLEWDQEEQGYVGS